MVALYIHWPFCRKKCPYCDFNSHVREEVDADRWETALLIEMRHMATLMPKQPLTSIFFGGGTPSLMPASIVAALLKEAKRVWGFDNAIEITLEANPTSSEAARFQGYREAGVNRLSLGVQAFDAEALQFLGREHSAGEALEAIYLAREIFPRMSFDLMYARPGQQPDDWQEELSQALALARGHLSLYQLTIEPDTPFARLYAKGGFTLPDAEASAELYEMTQSLCEQAGLEPYEISNYATPDEESRHNLTYWRGEPYLGIGPGAHGRVLDASGEWMATATLKSPERWLQAVETQGHGLEEQRVLPTEERAEEILLGGLRLSEGIAYEKVHAVVNSAKAELLEQMGLTACSDGQLRVTGQGRLVMERIVAELLT